MDLTNLMKNITAKIGVLEITRKSAEKKFGESRKAMNVIAKESC